MDGISNHRKGQVFSIDVLFALLPIIMIIGASLQYLYIAEEDMKTIALDGRRDVVAQGLGDYMVAKYLNDPINISGDYCSDLHDLINDYKIAGDYDESYFVWDYHGNERWCKRTHGYAKNWIARSNSTASSQERFVLEYDSGTGEVDPGKIVGVSVIVEEKIP